MKHLTTKGEIMKILTNYVSESTAYQVDDYPYGYTLRCKIRYWIETTKYGQRFCSQTLNPKTNRWNKPKKGNYCTLMILYIDDKTGYVEHDSVNASWIDSERLNTFLSKYSEGITSERDQKMVQHLKAIVSAKRHMEIKCKEKGVSNVYDLPFNERQKVVTESTIEGLKDHGLTVASLLDLPHIR